MSSLAPHQERVREERAELGARIAKLDAFFDSATFQALPGAERGLLAKQCRAMHAYLTVLNERLALWGIN